MMLEEEERGKGSGFARDSCENRSTNRSADEQKCSSQRIEKTMSNSWHIGRAFGINVHIHWTMLLLGLWILLSNPGTAALFALALTGALFGCVVLHELGHALAARHYGIATRDITLYPIGGVARLERMSEKPWEEFWIAVAGPAVNVLIAGLLFSFLTFRCAIGRVFPLPPLGLSFLSHMMLINVVLVLFNLVPAFPMDGGRVLRAMLALRLGHLKATEIAVRVGVVLAVLMGLAGYLYFENFSMIIIAV